MIKPLIAGNWKMNGLRSALEEITALETLLDDHPPQAPCDILICPPATLLSSMQTVAKTTLVGGQDCHPNQSGAHTGDVSAQMIKDSGGQFIIVGHSERRADHGETDATINTKAQAVLAAGLAPIICVGESRAEREQGLALEIVEAQLKGSMPTSPLTPQMVIAYEPVWAIGTGLTPTLEDIDEMHRHIRTLVTADTRILYGGSVKPGNAKEILAINDVNGALVGGASLKARDFHAIITAA